MTDTPNNKPQITVSCLEKADPKVFQKTKTDITEKKDAEQPEAPKRKMIDERFVNTTPFYSIH